MTASFLRADVSVSPYVLLFMTIEFSRSVNSIVGHKREIWLAWRIQDSVWETICYPVCFALNYGSFGKGTWQGQMKRIRK